MARFRESLLLIPALPFLFLGFGHRSPLLVPPPAAAAGDVAAGHFSLTDAKVHVYDLAGHVEVVAGSGSAVQVDATFGGRDASRLGIANVAHDGQALVVKFPSDHIRWVEHGDRSSTTVDVNGDGTFRDRDWTAGLGGHRVRIDGRPGGLDAWADLRIAVPRGQQIDVRVGVGHVTVTNVDGALSVGCSASDVSVNGAHGRLRVATGSGDIEARDVDGEQAFETGSGSLHASRLTGGAVKVGTGSGDVTVESVQATNLRAQTGSGELSMSGVSAPEVVLGTGSGDVSVQLLRRIDRLKVSTGSGGVRITAPPDLGAAIRVTTGSGGVESDFPLSGVQRGSGSFAAVVGDGRGDIFVTTGSGDVALIRR